MSLNEVSDIDVVSTTLLLYQLHLSSDEVPPVLKSELRQNIDNVHDV